MVYRRRTLEHDGRYQIIARPGGMINAPQDSVGLLLDTFSLQAAN
jgi:hypothetical protein